MEDGHTSEKAKKRRKLVLTPDYNRWATITMAANAKNLVSTVTCFQLPRDEKEAAQTPGGIAG
jgi:hypothetical protein